MTILSDKLFGTFIGIEFKEGSLVISYLKNSLSGIALLSSSYFTLKDDEGSMAEIKEYLSRYIAGVSKVFVCMPDAWAVTKFIDVPATKDSGSLAQLMSFEIARHIPFELANVAYDFQVVSEKDNTFSVSFVAVRKEKVEYVKEVLENLSLKADSIMISSFAVLDAIELSGIAVGGWKDIIGLSPGSGILCARWESNINLYVDNLHASLAIVKRGLCVNLRFFDLSDYTSRDEFMDEVAKYLVEVQSRYMIERFERLLLSGDTPALAGMADKLESRLEANEVYIGSVQAFSAKIKGLKINGQLASIGACYAGLGQGTYRINFLPHKMDYKAKKMSSLTMKVFVALIAALIAGIFSIEAVKHRKYLSELDKVLAMNEPKIMALVKLTSDMNRVKKHIEYMETVRDSEITLEVLSELASTLPKDTWITNLNYRGINIKNGHKEKTVGELVINGYADSSATLIPLIEDSAYFDKVEFVGPIKKAKDKEQFKISARVIRPGGDKKE